MNPGAVKHCMKIEARLKVCLRPTCLFLQSACLVQGMEDGQQLSPEGQADCLIAVVCARLIPHPPPLSHRSLRQLMKMHFLKCTSGGWLFSSQRKFWELRKESKPVN